MEQLIEFNGVKILMTTGEQRSEVQNWFDEADIVIAVYPDRVRVIKRRAEMEVTLES